MRRPLFFVVAAAVFLLDQLTKFLIVRAIPEGDSIPLVPSVFYLTHTVNTGAAFGVFPHATLVLAFTALIAVGGIIFYATRVAWPIPVQLGFALALPLGGAAGNFLDRVRLGHVVDFFDVWLGKYEWPVFNVADSAICVGVALLAFAALRARPASAEPTNGVG